MNKTIVEAIEEFKAAQSKLGESGTTKTNAQSAFDAAQVAKQTADADYANAVSVYNGTIDTLIEAANASKIATA